MAIVFNFLTRKKSNGDDLLPEKANFADRAFAFFLMHCLFLATAFQFGLWLHNFVAGAFLFNFFVTIFVLICWCFSKADDRKFNRLREDYAKLERELHRRFPKPHN